MSEGRNLSLSEAVTVFLASLSPEQRQGSQQELNRFVRWYGGERALDQLSAREIDDYGKNISAHVIEPVKRLEPVRSFLSYAKKQKLISVSLAPHLRVSKAKQGRTRRRSAMDVSSEALTPDGHAALKAELDNLTSERPGMAEQLRHAAADKDFRENAPLEAARERQGQIEARIREIDAILKASTVMQGRRQKTQTVGVGCTVQLCDLGSGEQSCYTLVSPSEANPANGKLSIASPIGKALLDHEVGAVVDVHAPVGKFKYRIEHIKG